MAAVEAYLGLARKYRPQRFEDLVGQEEVAQSLSQALRQNKVVHGHLLAGSRGTGKTTTARILARALNCAEGPTATPCGVCRHCIDIAIGNDLDVLEIDGASNNGIENIRDLRERINLAPFSAHFKVYIIDEVHMLSTPAFNALLKTLEEPPPGVVFIFATTELEKVPETIRSRCVLHQFRRLTTDDIIRRLAQVAQAEGIALEAEAAREIFGSIARGVDGGMRDALVILDQLLALTDGRPTPEAAVKLLGLAEHGSLADAVDWMVEGRPEELLRLVDDLVARGRNLERFVKELAAYLRDLMLLQAKVGDDLTALGGDLLARARQQALALAPATLYNIIHHILELEERLKRSTQARFLVEFAFLRLARIKPVVPIDQIMNRIRALPDDTLAAPQARPAEPKTSGQPARLAEDAAAGRPRPLAFADSGGHDRAAVTPAAAIPGAFDGLDREGLARLLLTQLPDTMQGLFRRYLAQISTIEVEGGALRLRWESAHAMGRRIFEKTDNTRAIEAALAQIAGRPMKLIHAEAVAGATPPAATKHGAASGRSAAGTAVLADGHPEFDEAPGDEEPEAEIAEITGPALGHGPQRPLESVSERPADPQRAPEPAADRRSALERAQDFLALDEQATRRLKLLQGMFHGRLIDDQGHPLGI